MLWDGGDRRGWVRQDEAGGTQEERDRTEAGGKQQDRR
jgi:hypothetical protein